MSILPVSEEWRAVVGYEGWYEVSSLGRVRRVMPARNVKPGSIRNLKTDKWGYQHVALYKDGKRKDRTVHSLVAEAFIGPRPLGHEVNHKYRVKSDNQPDKLEYMTGLQNVQHSLANGAQRPKGEQQWAAKLTEPDVLEIRRCFDEGLMNMADLARKHGVTHRTVSLIVKRQSWQHV